MIQLDTHGWPADDARPCLVLLLNLGSRDCVQGVLGRGKYGGSWHLHPLHILLRAGGEHSLNQILFVTRLTWKLEKRGAKPQ